jgi:DNA-directed RNA polymerase subunit RPC12/RpoP
MATTIEIACPKCENEIKVPADLAGKKIRCKECRHAFVVKAPPGSKAKAADKGAKAAKGAAAGKDAKPKPGAVEETDDKPYEVTDHDFLPRCAYCAKEMESEDQVVCLNCGYNHRTRERPTVAKTLEPTGGEWFLHLLPGIVCAIVTLLLIAGIVIMWTLFPRWYAQNSDPWWSFAIDLPGRIWGSVISLFIGFWFCRFAIKRLILHTRPTERAMKEKKRE